jgi:hypothetical protein
MGPQQPPEPSLFAYAPALIVLLMVVADSAHLADTDLWGHVRFGQAILSQGHLTRHDPYSYSAPGHLWLGHEWLTEVIMASAYNWLGIAGLKLWKFACTAATIAFLAAAEDETGAPIMARMGVLAVASIALVPQMQFRPQMFTWVLMAALAAGIARDNYGRKAPLWLCVPGFALWANLHGGFFVGLVALAVYSAVVSMQDVAGGRGFRRGVTLGAITIASLLATLLTPFGIGTWSTVLHSLTNPMTREVVSDWRPLLVVIAGQLHRPESGLAFTFCAIGIIAALGVTMALRPRGGDLPLVAIAVVMAIAAFMSVRNMALAVITAAAPLTRHFGLLISEVQMRAGVTNPTDDRPHLSPLTQMVIGGLAVLLAFQTGLVSRKLPAARHYPAGAVAFMESHGLHGNVLNQFEWGQYLIWHIEPASKVFADTRFDLVYPESVIRDYLDFDRASPRAASVLESYPHDFVLIIPDSAAYHFMLTRGDWKLIYRDSDSALFTRTTSAAANLAVTTRSEVGTTYFP